MGGWAGAIGGRKDSCRERIQKATKTSNTIANGSVQARCRSLRFDCGCRGDGRVGGASSRVPVIPLSCPPALFFLFKLQLFPPSLGSNVLAQDRFRECQRRDRCLKRQLGYGDVIISCALTIGPHAPRCRSSGRCTSFTVFQLSIFAKPIYHRGLGRAQFDPFRAIDLDPFVELFRKLEGLLVHIFEPVELALKSELAR